MDCLYDYRNAVIIHGDDVLAHSNWEISEKWLRQYGYVKLNLLHYFVLKFFSFLVDQATLNVSNRWRRERGEPELRPADIASEQSPSAS